MAYKTIVNNTYAGIEIQANIACQLSCLVTGCIMMPCVMHTVNPCRASDKCLKEKRKTINGDDLLCAMSTLGFEEYVEPLKLYLQKFREAEVSHMYLCI